MKNINCYICVGGLYFGVVSTQRCATQWTGRRWQYLRSRANLDFHYRYLVSWVCIYFLLKYIFFHVRLQEIGSMKSLAFSGAWRTPIAITIGRREPLLSSSSMRNQQKCARSPCNWWFSGNRDKMKDIFIHSCCLQVEARSLFLLRNQDHCFEKNVNC